MEKFLQPEGYTILEAPAPIEQPVSLACEKTVKHYRERRVKDRDSKKGKK